MFSVQYTSSFVRVEFRLLEFKSSKLRHYKSETSITTQHDITTHKKNICMTAAYSDNSSTTFFHEDLTNGFFRNVSRELPLHFE